jgi:hypothetical protein
VSLDKRAAEARRIVTIRQLQAGEAQAALAEALERETACEAELENAARAVLEQRAAWQACLQAARPEPAILQDFRSAIARLEESRARAALRLEQARAERARQEGAFGAALMREELARSIASKLAARLAHLDEERRMQTAEERTSYEWSRP